MEYNTKTINYGYTIFIFNQPKQFFFQIGRKSLSIQNI